MRPTRPTFALRAARADLRRVFASGALGAHRALRSNLTARTLIALLDGYHRDAEPDGGREQHSGKHRHQQRPQRHGGVLLDRARLAACQPPMTVARASGPFARRVARRRSGGGRAERRRDGRDAAGAERVAVAPGVDRGVTVAAHERESLQPRLALTASKESVRTPTNSER